MIYKISEFMIIQVKLMAFFAYVVFKNVWFSQICQMLNSILYFGYKGLI